MGGRGYSLFLIPYIFSFFLSDLFPSSRSVSVSPPPTVNRVWMYGPAESPKQANIKTSHGCRCRSFPVEPLSRSPWSVLTNSAISPHVSFSHTLHIQTDTLIKQFFFPQYSLTRYCVTHQKSTTPSLNHRRFGLVDKLLRRKGRNLQLRPASSYCRTMKTSHFLHIQLLVVFVVLRTVTSASWVSSAHVLFIWSQAADLVVAGFIIATHTERIASDITLWIASVVFFFIEKCGIERKMFSLFSIFHKSTPRWDEKWVEFPLERKLHNNRHRISHNRNRCFSFY